MIVANYVNDANEEVLNTDRPVVCCYTASWHGPCKKIGPLIDKLADKYESEAIVVNIDADDNPLSAKTYNIREIPTVLIFKNGEVVETIVGLQPYQTLEDALRKYL